jgi:hypothetical protein
MSMQQIASPPQSAAEVVVNENFASLYHQACYGKNPVTSTGLTWGYYGGRWGGFSVAAGTLTLTNATHYVVVARGTGAISTSTTTANWNNVSAFARVYLLTVAGGVVTATEDHRAGPFGVHGAWPAVRAINSQSAAYTFAGLDAARTVLHPSADTTARTFTIPANSATAFEIGAELEVVNQNAAGVITIAITTDTMRLAGAGTTGSRTLAANGIAQIKKVTATEWLISGVGLT